mgnify:CR=1 FL=1
MNFDTTRATTPYIKSQLVSGERHNLFRFHTLAHGSDTNQEYKISIFNVKPAGSSAATDYATFSVAVRKFSDTDKRKNVLETFNNVNLDPASPNYIKKVIGDRVISIDAHGIMTETCDYLNNSKHIYVECVEEGSFPIIAAPFGHAEYVNPIAVVSSLSPEERIVPPVTFRSGSDSNTSSNKVNYAGIDVETTTVKIDNVNYLAPIPTNAGTGSNSVFAFDSTLSYEMTGSDATDIAKRQFTVGFQSGFDGVTPTVSCLLYTSDAADE